MKKNQSRNRTSENSAKKSNAATKFAAQKLFLALFLILICFVLISASGMISLFKGSQTIAASPSATPPKVSDTIITEAQTQNGNEKISNEALSQIAALEQEKESRTPAQKKINSQLLYAIKMARQEPVANGIDSLDTGLKADEKGFIVVDITAHVTDNLLEKLNSIKAEVIKSFPQYHSVRARVPLVEIESLAALDDVIFIRPKREAVVNKKPATNQLKSSVNNFPASESAPAIVKTGVNLGFQERAQNVRNYLTSNLSTQSPDTGSVESQGDITHRANIARLISGFNGTGVKIGVLSDGVSSLAASQATGDLPATVTVLPGQGGAAGDDEGTAMLEIVHDVAPGAQLYFATAFSGIEQFAQNIKDLRAAGCDIIIDDVAYFVETPFQNGQAPSVISGTNGGVVIQAVNDVTVGAQAGALYFSSAGNSNNKDDNNAGVWEGDFVNGGATTAPLPTGSTVHSFGGGATFDTITVSGSGPIILHWSDPLGASANDYDLYSLNSAGTAVTDSSTDIQSGTQDPLEGINPRPAGERLVIVQKTGAANRFLHLNTNRGSLSISTAGVVFGHNAALNTYTCAATPAGPAVFSTVIGPFPKSFSTATNSIEIFSSDGPRRIFYNADGTPITPGNVSSTGGQLLQKPDITAADGVSTTLPPTTGLNPFFGTSAAAPHAGALAALLKSARPTATRTEIYDAMTSTAIDIEAPGRDRDSGAGIFMPIPALAALGVTGPAYIEAGTVTATEAPGNGNGKLEPGETANLTVQLNNIGLANATAISATLTTSTPGVTITQATQTYSNLNAINGSATNSTPFKFTLANNFPCGGTVSFSLALTYTGGISGTQTIPISVRTGGTSISTTLDATAPPAGAGYTATTGTQTGRLGRNGVNSNCGSVKPTPPIQDSLTNRRYDAYTFTSSTAGCVTITLSSPTSGAMLYSVAYNGSYNPTSIQTNYLGDPGTSTNGDSSYSFDVTAGQTFTIVVHEVPVGGGIGANYTLKLDGPVAGVCSNSNPTTRTLFDYDGDGRADVSVFRPASGTWYIQNSLNSSVTGAQFGASTDKIVPADYDNDGKTDLAVFRPSTGTWYLLQSTAGFASIAFGSSGDIPAPADYDGDGKADVAVFRPSTGTWFVQRSANGFQSVQFGAAGDVPQVGDYDNDGKANIALYRPSSGTWYRFNSSNTIAVVTQFGASGDIPDAADFDGDSRTDLAVFRPSTGTWYLQQSTAGFASVTFGANGDRPVAADFDSDSKADVAVFRPASGSWFINRSTGGTQSVLFGSSGDVPTEAAYVP